MEQVGEPLSPALCDVVALVAGALSCDGDLLVQQARAACVLSATADLIHLKVSDNIPAGNWRNGPLSVVAIV